MSSLFDSDALEGYAKLSEIWKIHGIESTSICKVSLD